MDSELKWIRSNMSLSHIDINCECIVKMKNSGNLADDFYSYGNSFFDAAESVIHYLGEEAAENQDIAKLDIWYFAMIYLYRQSLELLLKANIFKHIVSDAERKNVVGEVRHDLQQGFEKLLTLLNPETVNDENIKWTLTFFTDISCIDRESDMFRYPFGSNLNTLFDEQTHISLVATHDNMNRAYNTLKDIYCVDLFAEREYETYAPKLFIEGGNYYQQSVVGYKYSTNKFYPLFSSYEEVGNFLKEIILEQNKTELFMPMCYMYRNAVELGLKRLIIEDSHIERDRALKIVRKKKHSLLGLWNSMIDEINKYANAPDGDTTVEDTQKYIHTFHDFDQSSDLFRYPCNKNLECYFLTENRFDVANVSSCFQELCNFLDGVDSMLDQVKEYEAEMAAEMASYYSEYDY